MTIVHWRRRWRKASGKTTFEKVENVEHFQAAAEVLLRQTKKSMRVMQPAFPMFVLATSDDSLTIDLGPEEGFYTLELDEYERCVHLLSPVSGRTSYVLNAVTHEWICPQDGHVLKGKILGDLTHQYSSRVTIEAQERG